MKQIATQKLIDHITTTNPVDGSIIEFDLHEIIIKDTTTGELRYNKINIGDKTLEELWEMSEPCDYVKARGLEYPSWSEQFDDQYWDKKNGTDIWAKKIDEVKAKYPKSR